MPQPVSSVRPQGCTVFIGNNIDNPSDHRPALALLAIKVLAEWSILESFINGLFVMMLGANPRPAAAMYVALAGGAAQRAAFEAVADLALIDQQEKDVFAAISHLIRRSAKGRNKIAHWIWGHSPEIPDAVLLCDPVVLLEHRVAATAEAENPTGKDIPFPNNEIFAFFDTDFKDMSANIQLLMGMVSTFRFLVNRHHPANTGGAQLQQLLQQPQIRSFVDDLNKRRQNAQAAQQRSSAAPKQP